ncbi:hypothetical protein LCGC14_0577720 [marine sediment metagenome]|uniref:Uncharacterized protein n=1 Tax=marine sediment metagenome TaxID=412755 RepID=A0A0F9U3M1_9ZZZZ
MDNYSMDNMGNRIPADVHASDPVAGSGITLATGTAGDDKTQTLVGGQMYVITLIGTAGTAILASSTGVTSTAANIEFVFPAGYSSVFRMPEGLTTLYFEGTESSKNAYLRKLNSDT